MFVGVVLKLAINIFLVPRTEFNVNGAAIGTTVCYLYIFIADFIAIVRTTGFCAELAKVLPFPLFRRRVPAFRLISGICCFRALFRQS